MFPYDRFHDRTTILGYDKKLKQVMAVTEPSPACFPWYARQDSNPPKADFAALNLRLTDSKTKILKIEKCRNYKQLILHYFFN